MMALTTMRDRYTKEQIDSFMLTGYRVMPTVFEVFEQ